MSDELLEYQIFHRVMSVIGVMGHVDHNVVHQVEIRMLLVVNDVHLTFERSQKARNVSVVGLELLHDFGHAVPPVFCSLIGQSPS